MLHNCEALVRKKLLAALRTTTEEICLAHSDEEPNYMGIFEKIKEVYKAATEGFRSPLTVTFGDDHWREFGAQ
jgi:hypothetical protein